MPGSSTRPIRRQIAATRRTLKSLDRSLRNLASLVAKDVGNGSRRRPALSPKARASLKLQGRYMGYMRQLKPNQKSRIRKIRETKGVRAAISQAKQLVKG